jgi:hypothetical protein
MLVWRACCLYCNQHSSCANGRSKVRGTPRSAELPLRGRCRVREKLMSVSRTSQHSRSNASAGVTPLLGLCLGRRGRRILQKEVVAAEPGHVHGSASSVVRLAQLRG